MEHSKEKMKIIIQPTFGKKTSFRIHVKPYFTVKTTKIKLCRKRGIRQVIHLFKEEAELENQFTLSHYDIEESDTLTMSTDPEKEIKVKASSLSTEDGSLCFTLNSSASFQELRNRMYTCKLGHPTSFLLFEENGQPAKDFLSMNVEESCDLPLHYFGIHNNVNVMMKIEETLRLLVHNMVPQNGLPAVQLLPFQSSDTITVVKQKIIDYFEMFDLKKEHTKVPTTPEQLILYHYSSGHDVYNPLNVNNNTLFDYDLIHLLKIYALPFQTDSIAIRYCNRDEDRTIYGIGSKSGPGGEESRVTMLALRLAIQDQLGVPVKDAEITATHISDDIVIDNVDDNALLKDFKDFKLRDTNDEMDAEDEE